MVDIIFLALGVAIVAFCAMRGFFRSLMGFFRIFLAIAAAYLFGSLLGPILSDLIPSISGAVANFLGYLLFFVLAMIAFRLMESVIAALIKRISLIRKLDILLGALIRMVLSTVLLFVLASVLKYLPATREIYTDSMIVRFFGDSVFLEKIKMLDFGKAWFETLLD